MENVNDGYLPPQSPNLVGCYAVFVYGNQFVCSSSSRKFCHRKARSLAKNGKYVEVWYYSSDEIRSLVEYFN